MGDDDRLGRFLEAQAGVIDGVLAQLRRGRKTTHWMWFVFPQLDGLGSSAMARRYAITSLDEARAYLAHPVLGPRLFECAATLTQPAGTADLRTAEDVFGGIDAMKLRSSMTLFARAAPHEPVFASVLERFFGGEPDLATDRLLAAGG